MPAFAPCPRCGPSGDVVAEARGRARCSTCSGGFVSVEAATANFAQLGVSAAKLRTLVVDQGQRHRGCPTCDRVVSSFAIRREFFHACLACRAVWADQGAWQRVGVAQPRTDEAPFQALARSGRQDQAPAGTWDTPGLPDAPVDEGTPFVPAVGAFSERISTRGYGAILTIGAGVVIAGLIWFAYKSLVQTGEPVVVGDGMSVLFWSADRKVEPVEFAGSNGSVQAQRIAAPKGPTSLEVVHGDVPALAGLGAVERGSFANVAAIKLYGKFVKFDEVIHKSDDGAQYHDFIFFTEEGKGTHGVGRVYMLGPHFWAVTAIGEQKMFTQSAVAGGFVGSLKKR